MQPEPSEQAHAGMRLGRLGAAVVAASVAGLLFFGVRPNRLLDIARTSGASVRAAPAVSSDAPPPLPPLPPPPPPREPAGR